MGSLETGDAGATGTMLPAVVTGWIATAVGVGATSFDARATDFIHERLACAFHVMSSNSRSTLVICAFMASRTSERSRSCLSTSPVTRSVSRCSYSSPASSSHTHEATTRMLVLVQRDAPMATARGSRLASLSAVCERSAQRLRSADESNMARRRSRPRFSHTTTTLVFVLVLATQLCGSWVGGVVEGKKPPIDYDALEKAWEAGDAREELQSAGDQQFEALASKCVEETAPLACNNRYSACAHQVSSPQERGGSQGARSADGLRHAPLRPRRLQRVARRHRVALERGALEFMLSWSK